jgi:hypothetical protein
MNKTGKQTANMFKHMMKLTNSGLWKAESDIYGTAYFSNATLAALWIIDATAPIFGLGIIQSPTIAKADVDGRNRKNHE